LVAALAITLVWVVSGTLEMRVVQAGDKVPDFSIVTNRGRTITPSNFGGKLLMVNFWAAWCAPCKAIAPTVDALSEEYKDRVKFCKVNVDDNAQAPSKYGVRGIPTLILFKKGEVADQLIGAASRESISSMIDKSL